MNVEAAPLKTNHEIQIKARAAKTSQKRHYFDGEFNFFLIPGDTWDYTM